MRLFNISGHIEISGRQGVSCTVYLPDNTLLLLTSKGKNLLCCVVKSLNNNKTIKIFQ